MTLICELLACHFESPGALILTPIAHLFLCCRAVSTAGELAKLELLFACLCKGFILWKFYMQDAEGGPKQARWFGSSCQPCKTGLWPFMRAPLMG